MKWNKHPSFQKAVLLYPEWGTRGITPEKTRISHTRVLFLFLYFRTRKTDIEESNSTFQKVRVFPPKKKKKKKKSLLLKYLFFLNFRPWEELWWGKKSVCLIPKWAPQQTKQNKSRSQIRKDGPDLHCFYTWKNSIVITEILEIIKYS